ncbi:MULTISPECIES: DUF6192 family protein [unclassified Kitasatospora]|uniref:DUF6192 family protein n=1 Tax=unclassified Kitasatospora TaxID=2633591 RepID=UPI0012F7F4AD|nr:MULTISPECIES: DUF6192 family protein [unclassified Kitasatospora]
MAVMSLPAGYTKAVWERHMRSLVKIAGPLSGHQFLAGDGIVAVVEDGDPDEVELDDVIDSTAHRMQLASETVMRYYTTALRWPEAKRAAGVGFTVHFTLSSHPQRFRVIKNPPLDPVTGEHRWSVDAARRKMTQLTRHAADSDERLERADKVLKDDDDAAAEVSRLMKREGVARKVVADPKTRHELRKAEYEHWRAVEHGEEEEEDSGSAPGKAEKQQKKSRAVASRPRQEAEIVVLLQGFAGFFATLQKTIPEIHAQDYTPQTKAAVLEAVAKGRAVLDWCESAITTGRTGMDRDLVRLLEGG